MTITVIHDLAIGSSSIHSVGVVHTLNRRLIAFVIPRVSSSLTRILNGCVAEYPGVCTAKNRVVSSVAEKNCELLQYLLQLVQSQKHKQAVSLVTTLTEAIASP